MSSRIIEHSNISSLVPLHDPVYLRLTGNVVMHECSRVTNRMDASCIHATVPFCRTQPAAPKYLWMRDAVQSVPYPPGKHPIAIRPILESSFVQAPNWNISCKWQKSYLVLVMSDLVWLSNVCYSILFNTWHEFCFSQDHVC